MKVTAKLWQSRVADRIAQGDTGLLEVVCGFTALAWGLWLVFPWQSFTRAGPFRVLVELADLVGLGPHAEMIWGALFALVGFRQLIAPVDARRRTAAARASAICWFFTIAAVLASTGSSPSLIMYVMSAVANTVIVFKLTGRDS